MSLNLPYPPMSETETERQFYEIRKYLFRLVSELNNSGDAGNQSGTGGTDQAELEKMNQELRSTMTANAKAAQLALDSLERTIRNSYVPKDTYNTFVKSVEQGYVSNDTFNGFANTVNGIVQSAVRFTADPSQIGNLPNGVSAGCALIMGQYYILLTSTGALYTGTALSGDTTITWTEK